MLSFTVFELQAIFTNLAMMDTIFGTVSLRDEIMEKLKAALCEYDFSSYDVTVDVEVSKSAQLLT